MFWCKKGRGRARAQTQPLNPNPSPYTVYLHVAGLTVNPLQKATGEQTGRFSVASWSAGLVLGNVGVCELWIYLNFETLCLYIKEGLWGAGAGIEMWACPSSSAPVAEPRMEAKWKGSSSRLDVSMLPQRALQGLSVPPILKLLLQLVSDPEQ